MKKFIIICSVLTITFLYWNNKYVEFSPVYFINGKYEIKNSEIITKQFRDNLKNALHFYDHSFTEKNGKIFIKNKLYRNKELVYNYTKKAKDSIWLSEHSITK